MHQTLYLPALSFHSPNGCGVRLAVGRLAFDSPFDFKNGFRRSPAWRSEIGAILRVRNEPREDKSVVSPSAKQLLPLKNTSKATQYFIFLLAISAVESSKTNFGKLESALSTAKASYFCIV